MKGQKTGGRVKGTPNKSTTAVKEMILAALDRAGGIKYLVTQAKANPAAFMTLVGKVLPLQVQGDKDNPLEVRVAGSRDALAEKLGRILGADEPAETDQRLN